MDHSLTERLKLRERVLVETIKKVKADLKKAPKGRLKFIRRNTRVEYYWVEPKTGRRRYITKNNLPFAMALAQKSYNKQALKLAEEELKLIRQLINQIMKGTVDGIYDILAKERKQLITPLWKSDEEFKEEWLKRESCTLGFEQDDPVFVSNKGERVRSKTELFIANSLYGANVAYLYECRLNLIGHGTVYPDFLVLDIKNRRTIVWEHLGKMHDPEYVERNLRKINAYLKNGYVLGETLILTFESTNIPIDTTIIEGIIKHYFL